MNQLSSSDRVRIVACLVEGNSLRSTCRITGFHRTTIMNLLTDLGEACAQYQSQIFRNLPFKRMECDEIWCFVGCKERNVPTKQKGRGRGDIWTWTAIDTESKVVPCWHVGLRDLDAAYRFMHDLSSRMAHRIQLSTDGYRPYAIAAEDAFGSEIDYGQVVKVFSGMETSAETRYSRPKYVESRKVRVKGKPDMKKVSTSICERNNLTMRMGMRRFTRLTNAFSKKVENHAHAVALHFMHYNFCRVHGSLRVTPAMQAALSDHVWDLEEIVRLLD